MDQATARRFHKAEGVFTQSTAMNLEQLLGRYDRLKQELSFAYRARPWHSNRIDRLANDIAVAEREIAELQTDICLVPLRLRGLTGAS